MNLTINNIQRELKKLKVAIVVEELTQLGGAERLLDYYLEVLPDAPVYTLVWDKGKTLHRYDKFDVRPSFIQKLPFGVKHYKWYLTLMPRALESFDLKKYDIVLSITSALCKGVKTREGQLHVCYCNTPTRWLWLESKQYLKTAPIPFFIRPLMPSVINYLKRWDLKAAKRPDYFIANSKNVQARIQKYYHRDSEPIFVPVDASKFKLQNKSGGYYLIVSRLEPYKKVEMVINAFRRLKLPLKIVGGGTKYLTLKKNAPENIEFLGRVNDQKLASIYAGAMATIFPQDEDAGIVPLESMACGRPVVAYKKGGALETIIDGQTGILFPEQREEALIAAIKRLQKIKFDSKTIRKQAEKFDKELFKQRVFCYIIDKYKSKQVSKSASKQTKR